jgi:hypothetical protein
MRFRRSVSALAVAAALGGTDGNAHAAHSPESAGCRLKVEVVFWTASHWHRLANALAADVSPCADYYISLPPVAQNQTMPRAREPERIRALGLHFHAMAEFRIAGETGWASWVAANAQRFDSVADAWYYAGVRFRRLMAAAGYDVAAGDTWLLNEFNVGTRRDSGSIADLDPTGTLDVTPYVRANMRALVHGLEDGPPDGSLPRTEGAAEIGIQFSHQNIPNIEAYKAELKAWLGDAGFWAHIRRHVRWLARETYPDARFWGVPGSSREERRRHLSDYMFHIQRLAEAGPVSVRTARLYLRRAYMPFGSATWAARGPDPFQPAFCCGHGYTLMPADQMKHFVSEQVYAMRRYAARHPRTGSRGRLGFSWQPVNNLGLREEEFLASLDAIAARLASAIRHAYGPRPADPAAACTPPGTEENWCAGELLGAAFVEQWRQLRRWD